MGKVYITGDKHGSVRMFFDLAEKGLMQPDDVMIITGDASYIWNEDYPSTIQTLEQLFPGTLLFIDGNHENHRILRTLPMENWQGGKVHRAGKRVFHLLRGEIYEIFGERYFTFGGARTVSRYVEGVEGIDWWNGEEPDEEELRYGRQQLSTYLDRIDYVITHEAPLSARKKIARPKRIDEDYRLPEILEEWYGLLSGNGRMKRWYFGHMHVDQEIAPDLRAIFSNLVEAGSGERIQWA